MSKTFDNTFVQVETKKKLQTKTTINEAKQAFDNLAKFNYCSPYSLIEIFIHINFFYEDRKTPLIIPYGGYEFTLLKLIYKIKNQGMFQYTYCLFTRKQNTQNKNFFYLCRGYDYDKIFILSQEEAQKITDFQKLETYTGTSDTCFMKDSISPLDVLSKISFGKQKPTEFGDKKDGKYPIFLKTDLYQFRIVKLRKNEEESIYAIQVTPVHYKEESNEDTFFEEEDIQSPFLTMATFKLYDTDKSEILYKDTIHISHSSMFTSRSIGLVPDPVFNDEPLFHAEYIQREIPSTPSVQATTTSVETREKHPYAIKREPPKKMNLGMTPEELYPEELLGGKKKKKTNKQKANKQKARRRRITRRR